MAEFKCGNTAPSSPLSATCFFSSSTPFSSPYLLTERENLVGINPFVFSPQQLKQVSLFSAYRKRWIFSDLFSPWHSSSELGLRPSSLACGLHCSRSAESMRASLCTRLIAAFASRQSEQAPLHSTWRRLALLIWLNENVGINPFVFSPQQLKQVSLFSAYRKR